MSPQADVRPHAQACPVCRMSSAGCAARASRWECSGSEPGFHSGQAAGSVRVEAGEVHRSSKSAPFGLGQNRHTRRTALHGEPVSFTSRPHGVLWCFERAQGSSDTCDQVLRTVAGICTPAPVGCDGFGTPLWQGGTSRHSGRRRVGGPGQADRHRRRVSEGDSPNFSRYCTENRPRWRNPHLVAASDTVVVDGSASRSHVRTAFIRTSRRYPIGVVP